MHMAAVICSVVIVSYGWASGNEVTVKDMGGKGCYWTTNYSAMPL